MVKFSEDFSLEREAKFDHRDEMIELMQGCEGMKSCLVRGKESRRCVVLLAGPWELLKDVQAGYIKGDTPWIHTSSSLESCNLHLSRIFCKQNNHAAPWS